MDLASSGIGWDVLAVVAAVGSAATFGLSTSLQHRVVESTRPTGVDGVRFWTSLGRRRSWRIGICLSVVAFGLHAGAITLGGLALVQPIIVTGIVFAVWIRARLDHRWPSWHEIAWSAVVWAGLTLFIATLRPSPADDLPNSEALMLASCAVLVAAAAFVRLAGRAKSPEARGLWLGAAAGVLFGLVAALLRLVAIGFADGGWRVLVGWPPWVMLAAGLWAMSLNQRAYQSTRLSVSMPILNVVDVIVALGLAATLFGERLASSPLHLGVEAASLGVMTLAVGRLARRQESAAATPAEAEPVRSVTT